ncbi:receptor-like protein EIX2 [Aristolochia californica]|uniref:receptor-like protein EIX2 n=1 Tax=Aristolochia californica TaxID=171875 RepID=UPI0035D83724
MGARLNSSEKLSVNLFRHGEHLMEGWVHSSQVGCSDSERAALTKFKRKLIDPSNVLTSWDDSPDCCKWSGVTCHNETGYVNQLDLHYGNLSGVVDPALMELKHLKHLKYLDLSGNHFDGVKIPEFFGSLKELKHLNISYAGFGGRIPHHLGNLSYLELLDVSSSVKSYSYYMSLYNILIYSSCLNADSLDWMVNMPLLKHLEMNFVNLSMIGTRWFHVMNSLSSLQILHLRGSYLSDIPPAQPFMNLTQLRSLDLSHNQFFSEIPNWFANITTLVSIDLNANKFYGDMSFKFPTLPCLEELQLGYNYGLTAHMSKLFQGPWKSIRLMFLREVQLYGELPKSIGNFSSLQHLILGVKNGNQFIKGIPKQMGHLHNLKSLMLYGFEDQTGSMREWLCPLINLQILYIHNCHFPESIPRCLGGFSSLTTLAFRNSMLKGPLLQEHFQNLSRLRYLDLSSNSFEFHTPLDWVPSFQAKYLLLGSCRFGSQFPSWLQSQKNLHGLDLSNTTSGIIHSRFWNTIQKNLHGLDLSNTSLSIIPSWYWNVTPLSILILRMNNISGSLPNNTISTLSNAWFIDLSYNYFKGPIPYFTSPLMLLDLSHNQFSGVLRSMFDKMKWLGVLDLSHNNLIGSIPESLASCESLIVLNLGANNLSGSIPWSSVKFTMIRSLDLGNNQLSGEFPSFLKDCARLQTLDLGENKFTGSLPAWIGTNLPNLRILRLRSNMFTGTIPQLLNLHHLKVFDLSYNHLIGSIPESLKDLVAMRMDHTTDNTMDTKYGYYQDRVELSKNGLIYEYGSILYLVISLDLSNNNLSGKIPEAIGDLLGLKNLNLSGNQLSGKIPESIENLHQLENLNLSKNHLCGLIPSTIADLTFLSHLNLSYNNLSGKIPLGQQIQTLNDPSIYAKNDHLCGYPLRRDCERDAIVPLPSHNEVDDGSDIAWLYAGIGPGFAVGLFIVFGILLFKTSWRVKYFRFVDTMQEYFHCLHKLARYIDGCFLMALLRSAITETEEVERGPERGDPRGKTREGRPEGKRSVKRRETETKREDFDRKQGRTREEFPTAVRRPIPFVVPPSSTAVHRRPATENKPEESSRDTRENELLPEREEEQGDNSEWPEVETTPATTVRSRRPEHLSMVKYGSLSNLNPMVVGILCYKGYCSMCKG